MNRFDRMRPISEFVVLILATIGVYSVAVYVDVFDGIDDWLHRHENWELDELLLTVVFFFAGLSFLSFRRWKEAMNETRARESAEETLRDAYSRIEEQVKERTLELAAANTQLVSEIENRKAMELTLRESEERFRLAMDATNDGLWDWDIQTGKVYYSPGYFRMLGYEPGDLVGDTETWLDLVHPDDRASALSANKACMNDETQSFAVEFRMHSSDGSWRWILGRGRAAQRDESGRVVRMVGTHVDITDRKQIKSVLENAKRQWETTFDAISDWVCIVDGNHTIVRSNKAASKFLGLPLEEIIGRRCYEVVHCTNQPISECPVSKAIQNGQSDDYEFQTSDGRWLRVSVDPISQEPGAENLFVHVVENVTRRKALEDRHRQIEKTESLGRMAGAIAHHFNNQLAVVIGNLEMALLDLPDGAVVREDLNQAMSAARRSSEISTLMLIYIGQNITESTETDLSEVCRQSLNAIRDTMPQNIPFNADLLPSGPVVRANFDMVQRILVQLVTNAWEAIEAESSAGIGEVRLATRVVTVTDIPKNYMTPVDWEPPTDRLACIEVSDTGCGVPEDKLDKIFDPFFTTKFPGRGLGLAVIQGIIKQWGGAIGVESRKNQGSTFRVYLPLAAERLHVASNGVNEKQAVQRTGTLLLVEDLDIMRRMSESMLRRIGFDVIAVSGGAGALELFRRDPGGICCVVTDLSMPEMNGWELISALREIRPDIPAILMSGHDESWALGSSDSFAVGERLQAFLHKPFSMADLREAIDKALGKP